jgi:hypothetical protein
MTVSLTVNNPAQTISLEMNQEQPTQSLSLIVGSGTVSVARQPRSSIDMLLDEGGLVIDFMLDEYITKS